MINLLDQRVWSLTPHFVSYTVSKAALWALTQSHGAGARAAHPGQRASAPARRCPARARPPEQFARQCAIGAAAATAPRPDEVARAVLAILALPAMTGQMIALDGGQHLQWASGRTDPPLEE